MTTQERKNLPEAWRLMDREATLDNTRSTVWEILRYLEAGSSPPAAETPACEHYHAQQMLPGPDAQSCLWCMDCGALKIIGSEWRLPRHQTPVSREEPKRPPMVSG